MTAAFVFLMCWAAMTLAGNTPIGRFMRRVMVAKPVAAASRVSRVHVAMALVIGALIILHAVAGDDDPIRVIGLFAPDAAIWLTGFGISAVLEAAAGLAAALVAMRHVDIRRLRHTARRRIPKRSESRIHRTRRSRRRPRITPANDDEDGASYAQVG